MSSFRAQSNLVSQSSGRSTSAVEEETSTDTLRYSVGKEIVEQSSAQKTCCWGQQLAELNMVFKANTSTLLWLPWGGVKHAASSVEYTRPQRDAVACLGRYLSYVSASAVHPGRQLRGGGCTQMQLCTISQTDVQTCRSFQTAHEEVPDKPALVCAWSSYTSPNAMFGSRPIC